MITQVDIKTGKITQRELTPEELAAIPVITEEQKAREEQERINQEARAYLAETDWYTIRAQETGVEVPADILQKRQEARDKVVVYE